MTLNNGVTIEMHAGPLKGYHMSEEKSAVLRKQVEYYLSDENLQQDKFFHDCISADPEGWLDMQLIVKCNKMKAMKASTAMVLKALQGSMLETWVDGDFMAVRRSPTMPLPQLIDPLAAAIFNTELCTSNNGESQSKKINTTPASENWNQKRSKNKKHPQWIPKKATSENKDEVIGTVGRTPLKLGAPCFQPSVVKVAEVTEEAESQTAGAPETKSEKTDELLESMSTDSTNESETGDRTSSQGFLLSPRLSDAGSSSEEAYPLEGNGFIFQSAAYFSNANSLDQAPCVGSKQNGRAFRPPPGLEDLEDPGPPPGLFPPTTTHKTLPFQSSPGLEFFQPSDVAPRSQNHLISSTLLEGTPPPGLEAATQSRPLPPWRQRKGKSQV